MNRNRRSLSIGMLLLFLFSTVPIQAQAPMAPSVTIATHWIEGGSEANDHAYLLTFSDNGSYDFQLDIEHERNDSLLEVSWSLEWGYESDQRTALVELNTSVEWADIIGLTVSITEHNGQTLVQPISVERQFEVGIWNQPMDDHEIMLDQRKRIVCRIQNHHPAVYFYYQ